MRPLVKSIILVTAAGFVILGLAIYDGVTSEKITLQKKERVCTETSVRTVIIMTGKTPMPIRKKVCTRYENEGE